ncbi:MAG: hypothetical protein AAFQ83_04980 [Bacteroidota bacterium]
MKSLQISFIAIIVFFLTLSQAFAQLKVGNTTLGSGKVLAGGGTSYTNTAIFQVIGTSSNPNSIYLGRNGWNTYTTMAVTGNSSSNRGLLFKVYDGPSGVGKNTIFMNKLGMVGIGTASLLGDSKVKLELNEDAASGTSDRLFFRMNAGGGSYGGAVRQGDIAVIWTDMDAPTSRNQDAGLVFAPWSDGNKRGMRLAANGNVSIGVPHWDVKGDAYKLAVNGNIICEELKVQTFANWPDYVFADDYERMDLTELENYIEENNHLPNIPAASIVESEGIEVAKMTTLQMEKIEELTLYILELNKEMAELKAQLNELQNQE